MVNILDWQSFNEGYNKPRAGGKRRWSVKYKRKVNCSNARGFSQKQYCKRKRRGGAYKTESIQNYKLFESFDEEIKLYLSQIFLELEDEGYDIDVEGRWLRTETTEELTGFKINISGKDIGEDILPSIETSISYMSSQDFGRYFIELSNFGVLNIDELKSYLNLKKSLANPPKTTIQLIFRKV
jgi:hypothetical protein